MALKKSIGKKTLLMLTINAVLGTGIYFLPAIAARYSGSASILSWIIISLFAILTSFYFAELVSMFPKSGGAYEFVKNAFGMQAAFVFGWMAWIISNLTISMLIVGSIIYLLPNAGVLESLALAVGFILLFNFISYRGIGLASRMLLFFGIMTVASLVILIIPGMMTADISKFTNVFAAPPILILLSVYFIAETFFGLETTTYLTEEVKDARKVMPKMLIIANVIITVLACLTVFVALGNVDASTFAAQEAPLAFLAETFFGHQMGQIFVLIIFIPLIGTAASWIVSSPRLLFAMARDKILVQRFARIHKKYRTPYVAIAFQTAVTIILTILAFGSYLFLLTMLVPLVVIMYSIIMLSLVKLRIEKPKLRRYFSAPFPRAGPIAIVMFNVVLLYIWLTTVSDAIYVFAMGIILIVLGFPLYIIIRLQTDKKFTENFYDRISFFWDKSFKIWYGTKDADLVVEKLRLNKNSNVLDFGCGSGNTTLAIARKAKNVIAVDLSEKQMIRAIDKIKSENLPNVIFVKGSHKMPRASFDAVTAIGVLEHLDNPRKYTKQLISSLKKGGRFYFLSFGKSFWIPSPEFLKDEKIRELFEDNVDFKIERTNKHFTEYVHIYGRKN